MKPVNAPFHSMVSMGPLMTGSYCSMAVKKFWIEPGYLCPDDKCPYQ